MPEYVFRSEWHIAADPDKVYQALADVQAYPGWWPQVVGARWVDENSGELRCRSLLPYELVFVVRRVLEDRDARVLQADLEGDLTGSSTWTISADGTGAVAVFDEQVDVRKRLLRIGGKLARPVLRYNHDLMMRAGEKGLRELLAG